jgi:hypothetical protein
MVKKVVGVLLIFGTLSFGSQMAFADLGTYTRTRLTGAAVRKYPFALLTNDFGILDDQDLALGSCIAEAAPFSRRSGPYPYWQCFEVKNIRLICDPAGNVGETMQNATLLKFEINTPSEHHLYIPRRAMEMKNCEWFQSKWRHAVRNERFACLSGAFSDLEDDKDQTTSVWVFDKFKTQNGCESYFHGACSPQHAKSHGCKL